MRFFLCLNIMEVFIFVIFMEKARGLDRAVYSKGFVEECD